MENKKIMDRLANIAKATNEDFEAIIKETGCTLSEVQAAWKTVKDNRKAEKQRIAEARFSLEFKGSKFNQSVVYLKDRHCFIFKNLDKNAIIYAYDNSGALQFKAVTVYTEKSKKYGFGKELARGQKAINLLKKVTEGMSYEGFYAFMMGRSNLDQREAKGAEKAIPVIAVPKEKEEKEAV